MTVKSKITCEKHLNALGQAASKYKLVFVDGSWLSCSTIEPLWN